MSQSQSTLVGDSFVSLSQTGISPIVSSTEEPLLELWLAQVGREQAVGLIPLGDRNEEQSLISAVSQLISPQNRLLTIPVYLLETNQIDLLAQWVDLNSYAGRKVGNFSLNFFFDCSFLNSYSIQSSLAYLTGVCQLHKGDTENASVSFEGKPRIMSRQ